MNFAFCSHGNRPPDGLGFANQTDMRNGTVAPTLLSRYSNDDRSTGRGAAYHAHDPSEDPTTRRPAYKRPPPAPISFVEPPSSGPTRSIAPAPLPAPLSLPRPAPRAVAPNVAPQPLASRHHFAHAPEAVRTVTPMPFAPVTDAAMLGSHVAVAPTNDASSSLVRSISKVEQRVWRRVSRTLGSYFPAMKTSRLAREIVLFTLVVLALLPVAGLVLAHVA